MKYVDNNLRQRLLMVDQMPVARGAMVLKKKATTIAGAKLRLSAANAEDLRKSKEGDPKALEEPEQQDRPADAAESPVADPEHAESQPKENEEPGAAQSRRVTIPSESKKDVVDPYLIKLDRMEVLKPASNERKAEMRKQLKVLEQEVIAAEEKVQVRQEEKE